MNFKKTAILFLLVLVSSVSFATQGFDADELHAHTELWAYFSSMLTDDLYFDFGHQYVNDLDEVYDKVDESRQNVGRIVSMINTRDEIDEALTVAERFQNGLGEHAKVGKALSKMIDMRQKYIELHLRTS